MNIILIGNGFDLSHNLKTSYSSFLKKIEGDYDNYPDLYKKLYEPRNKSFYGKSENSILEIIKKAKSENWCDIEELYFELLNSTQRPEKLNTEFEAIKFGLEKYLQEEDEKSVLINDYASIFERMYEHTYVINFNYTNTVHLYEKHFKEIIQIHGKLMTPNNPIVFGYAANQDETLELLNKNSDYYLENIKQYEYLSATNFERINEILSYELEKNVLIFGLGCGLSDQLILKTIFENPTVKGIYNFYFKGMHDHKLKLIKINRTTSENVGFKKFKPFPKSLKMPQFNQTLDVNDIDMFFEINHELEEGT